MKDLLGAALSGLCAIHCAASVLLVAGSGTFAVALQSEWAHVLFAAFAVTFAVLSFPSAQGRHGQSMPTMIGVLGIAMLVGGLLAHSLETPLTVTGGALAAFAHLWNRRLLLRLDQVGFEAA